MCVRDGRRRTRLRYVKIKITGRDDGEIRAVGAEVHGLGACAQLRKDEERTCSVATVNRWRATLRKALRMARRWKLIQTVPERS
jgi:hypothetical protein